MDSAAMPIIQLKLKYMKEHVMQHMGLYENQLSDAVNEEIEKAISEFNFGKCVRDATKECIYSIITAYFSYGNGRKSIENIVEEGLDKMFKKLQE